MKHTFVEGRWYVLWGLTPSIRVEARKRRGDAFQRLEHRYSHGAVAGFVLIEDQTPPSLGMRYYNRYGRYLSTPK